MRDGIALFFHRHLRSKDAPMLVGGGASEAAARKRMLFKERLRLARKTVEAASGGKSKDPFG